MSSTLNTKNNRLCVVAEYRVCSFFKIPDGLDLEDKEVIKNWDIDNDTLVIYFVNGKIEKYDALYSAFDDTGKETSDCSIENADDHGIEYSEDEEEEDGEICDCCGVVKKDGRKNSLAWTGMNHYRFCEPCKPRMEEILMNALQAISKMKEEEKELCEICGEIAVLNGEAVVGWDGHNRKIKVCEYCDDNHVPPIPRWWKYQRHRAVKNNK